MFYVILSIWILFIYIMVALYNIYLNNSYPDRLMGMEYFFNSRILHLEACRGWVMSILKKKGGGLSTPEPVEGKLLVSDAELPDQKKINLRVWLALAAFFLTVTAGYGLMFLVLENLIKG